MHSNFVVLQGKKMLMSVSIISCLIVLSMLGSQLVNHTIETMMQEKLLPIYGVETSEKKVALTFDCAWGAEDISFIIQTLEENEIEATFFVVGTWVEKYPEKVRQLSEAGMTLGNHSNSHSHVNQMSYGEVLEDMTKCNDKIERLTNQKVNYYRGPYGEYNNTIISVAKELNMQVIQWDVDTLDYEGKTVEEMCQRIQKKIRNGSILLMHNDTKHTAEGLQQIIDTIHTCGYEIVPLNELVFQDYYEINHEGRQLLQ